MRKVLINHRLQKAPTEEGVELLSRATVTASKTLTSFRTKMTKRRSKWKMWASIWKMQWDQLKICYPPLKAIRSENRSMITVTRTRTTNSITTRLSYLMPKWWDKRKEWTKKSNKFWRSSSNSTIMVLTMITIMKMAGQRRNTKTKTRKITRQSTQNWLQQPRKWDLTWTVIKCASFNSSSLSRNRAISLITMAKKMTVRILNK